MAENLGGANAGQSLGAGKFYGAVQGRREQCGAIFTDLSHHDPKKLPSHAHELAFFAVLLDGYYGERYLRQQKQFAPFTLMFRPAGIPHQDEIGPKGVKLFEIEIRPCWRNRLHECSVELDRGLYDCAGGELFWLAMKLYREMHTTADELAVESLLAELLCRTGQKHEDEERDEPSWLARVLERIAAEHSERLALGDLGAEAGVHPVHLSRVFRRWVGEGIGDYVRRLRIRSACELMLNPEMPMAEISFATGFADQSHFTRSFRKTTGMTPARFREMITAGA